jgi:hypothetical protein
VVLTGTVKLLNATKRLIRINRIKGGSMDCILSTLKQFTTFVDMYIIVDEYDDE